MGSGVTRHPPPPLQNQISLNFHHSINKNMHPNPPPPRQTGITVRPPRQISWIHAWTLFSDCSIALLQVWQSLFTVDRQLRHIIYLKDVNLLCKRAVWQTPGRSLCNHLKLPFNFAQKNKKKQHQQCVLLIIFIQLLVTNLQMFMQLI